MTIYAKIHNEDCLVFPYDFRNLQSENPFTDFGLKIDFWNIYPHTKDAIDNGFLLVEVSMPDEPLYNSKTQKLVPVFPAVLFNGIWSSSWNIVDLPTSIPPPPPP